VTVPTAVPADHRELLLRAYAAYESQDIEALVALVSDDVNWPDDDAGRPHGKDAVRPYWTEQWARTRTHDEPAAVSERNDGRTAV
jgi:ketosteroid isomerase-like protein